MSAEQELNEAIRLLASGLGMTDLEDTPYLRQIHDRLDEIKELQRQSFEASQAIRAEAQAVLEAHASSTRDYLEQLDEPEPIDFHPFASAPEGTTVRDLPDGGRLLTLVDGAVVRVVTDGGLVFIGEDGVAVPLEPARGGIVELADGRTLLLKPEAISVTHEATGIEGLPFDIEPAEVGEGRYRVELPGGTRLDVSHRDHTVVIGNTDGTVDVVGPTRIEGIGEEVEVRPVPGGARGFAALESRHRGIVEADGTIHLTTASGLDLVIRFPNRSERDYSGGPGDPPTLRACLRSQTPPQTALCGFPLSRE